MLAIGLGSLLLALLLQLGALVAERRSPSPHDRPPHQAGRTGAALVWLLAGVTLANLPLVLAMPRLLPTVLPPDAVSHAVVAQAVARSGLPHGWVDVYDAGFPFSIHYQSVALLLDAALIKLGVSAIVATNGLGIAALLASPIAFAWATHRGGLPPLACLAGAIALTVAAPEHPMVGGWESYLSQGLLSQVVAIPILIVCASAVVSGLTRSEARNGPALPARGPTRSRALPWIAALAVAAHTQVTVVAFVAALPAVLAAGTRAVRQRFLVASAGATVAALALYGTGALAFTVPFGTPKGAAWRLIGFPLDRLLDGDLLDQDRAPILTAAWIASAMFLLPFVRSRAGRGALLFGATAILVTFGRDAFLRMAPPVRALFGFVPPARMMVVVPLAVALAVAIALHELDARTRLLLGSKGPTPTRSEALRDHAWLRHAPLVACVASLAALTIPGRWRWARVDVANVDSLSGAYECGPLTPGGYSTRTAEQWVKGLDRGRFVVDLASFPEACPAMHGLDLASAVPLGSNVGGPGSEVGVLALAYNALRVESPHSAARAEVLGVRDVLASQGHTPVDQGWHARASEGDTLLLERIGGTDVVGVGCVVEEWTGANGALREALMADIEAGAPWLAEPSALVALMVGTGPVERRPVERGACDATGARVVEEKREPGAYEATLSNATDVDVVFRATYFPTWKVMVDGAPIAKRRIAPGFVSARIPAGVHRVEATVELPPGSLVALVVACLALALLGRAGPATRPAPAPE